MKDFLSVALLGALVSPIVTGPAPAQPRVDYRRIDSNDVTAQYDFPFVMRDEWGALPPKAESSLQTPVPHVVIHHSYLPGACTSSAECGAAMRSMQRYHQVDQGWWDIGYNFAVGGDGAAYEGRGWAVLGAHALHVNNVSIGICLIGDWTAEVPPTQQLETAKKLILWGVEHGHVQPRYTLLGHRQVRETECPGDALFREVTSWPHFSPHPSSPAERLADYPPPAPETELTCHRERS